jgi:hypothetical protein
VIGFAQIAASSPADVGGMTRHLMNNTLAVENSRPGTYYLRTGNIESSWYELALMVHDGEVEYSDAIDALTERWEKTWDTGDKGLREAVRMKFEDRFDVILNRLDAGLDLAPVAVVRPDIEAGVMKGLGIYPGMLLTDDEVSNLLAGRQADGALIEDKHYAVERSMPIDPKTGERRWSTPIGSYDFCPTPDKSISVAWAFATEAERAAIYQAHIEAAREAVAYIADEIGQASIGQGGKDGFEEGAVAWLEFTHHTSRRVQMERPTKGGEMEVKDAGLPGDPNLHTHFLIPNAVFCPSGRVGSLYTMGIRGMIFEADALYHARLGTKLRKFGFDAVLDTKTGAITMPVISQPVCKAYSKRTNAGEEMARQYTSDLGEDWDALSVEQRETRVKNATQSRLQKANADKDPVADFESWHRQAEKMGWQVPATMKLIGPPLRRLTTDERHRVAYEMSLPWLAEQLEHNSVVTHFVLRRAALRGLVHTGMDGLHDVDAVTKLMREEGVVMYGEKTPLKYGQEDGERYVSVTTTLHEAHEREFIDLVKAAAFDRSGAIQPGLLRHKIETSGLDFSDDHGRAQREAIERLGTGGRFGLLLAAAGAGKTTALQPLVASWKEIGVDVYGASLAWRQADDMVDAGIPKRNVMAVEVMLRSFADTEKPLVLGPQSVVAVDEWGLLGTRQGLELLRHRARMGFSIVALGDEKQCQAIEAGAIIDLCRRALGPENIPEIHTTVRQRGREAEISGLLRKGQAAEALAMKRADGTAELVTGGRDGVIERVAALYMERLQETGVAPTISAPTNTEAHLISMAVRDARRKAGLIAPQDSITIAATDKTREYSLRLAVGDKVRLFKSTGAAFTDGKGGSLGRNGSVLEVVGANNRTLILRAKSGRVGEVEWDKLRARKGGPVVLAYGDCMTIHTAQGSTTKEHIMALPSGSQSITGFTAYSAATRHKLKAWLLTSERAENAAVRQSRPVNSTHEITVDDKWAAVAKQLAYQPERDSALAMLDRVRRIREGSVEGFIRMVGSPDPRLRSQNRASEVVQQRWFDRSMDLIKRGIDHAIESLPLMSR